MERPVRRLIGSTDGAVAPTVALSLFGLIAVGGIAFDYARLASMDTELQSAADQAALAAASQLDGDEDSMVRAEAAARSLLANQTLMANDGNADGLAVTIPDWSAPDPDDPSAGSPGPSPIVFYDSRADAEAGTDEFTVADEDRASDAKFVRVRVAAREAVYALTPIVGALRSGDVDAEAVAGLGSAICKVPPLMICNPAGDDEDFTVVPGLGIKVVAHQQGQGWSPGNFGFLNIGQANNGAPDLLGAMAYQDAALTCQSTTTGDVDTGATVPAIDAANTRFDIYNFASGSGSTLGACFSGSCPAAANVTKDLVRPATASGNNACKIHNSGWQLPANQFAPRSYTFGSGGLTIMDDNGVDAMGLPRDNCHYTSFGRSCSFYSGDARIGNGEWARGDYFNKYHAGNIPSGAGTWTRYQTYIWEIGQTNMPVAANAGGTLRQHGTPVCSSGTLDPDRDRRVFTVAVANNCGELSGSSQPVDIATWVDMFFVEPGATGRGNGVTNDEIYLEVIREAETVGNNSTAQTIRRDVPYLVK